MFLGLILFIILIILGLWFVMNHTKKTPKVSYKLETLYEPKTDINLSNEPEKIKYPDSTSKIPKRIIQTQQFSKIPEKMKNAMLKIIKLNPDYGYKYYDDISARNFLIKHMNIDVVEAYDTLIPGAYKADLFRYCVLYIKGGVYIDSCFDGAKPLRECIFSEDKFISALDTPCSDKNGNLKGIYNAFMASEPKNDILKQVIDLVVERVKNKDKGNETLYPTGPLALGKIFLDRYNLSTLYIGEYEPGIRLIEHKSGQVCYNGKTIFFTKYPSYKYEMKKYNTGSHYGELWKNDMVFKKEKSYIPPEFYYDSKCPQCVAWNHRNFNVPKKYQKIIKIHKYTPSSIQPSKSQLVPFRIHQTNTFSKIPYGMYYAMKGIIEMNPEYNHFYFDLENSRNYIEENIGERALKCFDSLIPGAYKADFFRYSILFVEGGIYLDSGSVAITPLSKLIKETDKFIAPIDNGGDNINNNFICSSPKHPILGKALELMMDRIEKREYGNCDLYITGPLLFKDAFLAVVNQPIKAGDYGDGVRLIEYSIKDHCSSGIIYDESNIYFYNKYPSYRSDVSWYNPVENYAHLWKDRKIYN